MCELFVSHNVNQHFILITLKFIFILYYISLHDMTMFIKQLISNKNFALQLHWKDHDVEMLYEADCCNGLFWIL